MTSVPPSPLPDAAYNQKPKIGAVRLILGLILTGLGWGLSGLSTYTALSIDVPSTIQTSDNQVATGFGLFIVLLLAVTFLALVLAGLALGWVFSGIGALLLKRKLILILPLVNVLAFLVLLARLTSIQVV